MKHLNIIPNANLDCIFGINLPKNHLTIFVDPSSVLPDKHESTLHVLKLKHLEDDEEIIELNEPVSHHESTSIDRVLLGTDIEDPDELIISDIDIACRLGDKKEFIIQTGLEPCEYRVKLRELLNKTTFLGHDIYEVVKNDDGAEDIHILAHFFRSDDGIHKMEYSGCYFPIDKCRPAEVEEAEEWAKIYEKDGMSDEEANIDFAEMSASCLQMRKLKRTRHESETAYLDKKPLKDFCKS